RNSTISANVLLSNGIGVNIPGGGILLSGGGTCILDDSIVARNLGPSGGSGTQPLDIGRGSFSTVNEPLPPPTVLLLHHSLLGTNQGLDLAEEPVGAPDANGNLIGGPVHGVIDPNLSPLADNGGPVRTHALAASSPAVDAGNRAAVAGVGSV